MESLIEEKIVAAAIKHAVSGTVYSVAPPGRHHTVIALMEEKGAWDMNEYHKQGFITNKGRFLTRKESWELAKQNGQLTRDSIMLERLCSEDLW